MFQGEEAQAIALLQEVITQAQELGETESHSRGNIAQALLTLGGITLHRGDLEQAIAMLLKSLSLSREGGHTGTAALALAALGHARIMQDDRASAREFCMEGLALSRKIEFRLGIARNLIGLARIAATEDRITQAARLLGSSALWLNPDREMDPLERAAYVKLVASVRQELDERAFSEAWAQGQVVTIDQVLAEPAASTSAARSGRTALYPNDLTEREVEVLRLLAHGLTNAQIAERLIISRHTVNNHVRSILGKLGVSTRSGATRFAAEHHLL
jgi:DNA-binding NarL/FixJ family response regulator